MQLKLDTDTTPRRHVLLYGAPKLGKTTEACKFPKVLIAQDAISRGADFIKCPRVTLDDIGGLTQLPAFARGKYDTVVLDDMSEMIKRWAAGKGQESKEKGWNANQQKDYKDLYDDLIPAVQMLMRNHNVVITTHYVTADEIDATTYKMRKVVKPNLPERLDLFVRGTFQVVGYVFPLNGATQVQLKEVANDKARIVAGVRAGMKLSAARMALDGLAKAVMA